MTQKKDLAWYKMLHWERHTLITYSICTSIIDDVFPVYIRLCFWLAGDGEIHHCVTVLSNDHFTYSYYYLQHTLKVCDVTTIPHSSKIKVTPLNICFRVDSTAWLKIKVTFNLVHWENVGGSVGTNLLVCRGVHHDVLLLAISCDHSSR